MTETIAKTRVRLLVALLAIAVLAPAALAAAQYPRYWVWIAPELTPMTWIQTVLLMLAAAASCLVAVLGRLRGWGRLPRAVHWLLGAGFAYLAIDDRFALHERLRDKILAPRDIRIPGLSWLAPGDFQMLFIAVAGLLFLPFVLRVLRTDRFALVLFCLGVLTAGIAIGMDTIDPATMPLNIERLEQTLEECLELVAGALFLAALGVRLLGMLGETVAPTVLATPVAEPLSAPDGDVTAALQTRTSQSTTSQSTNSATSTSATSNPATSNPAPLDPAATPAAEPLPEERWTRREPHARPEYAARD